MSVTKAPLTENQLRRLERCTSQTEFDSVMLDIAYEAMTVEVPVYAEVTLGPADIERSVVQVGTKQVPMFKSPPRRR